MVSGPPNQQATSHRSSAAPLRFPGRLILEKNHPVLALIFLRVSFDFGQHWSVVLQKEGEEGPARGNERMNDFLLH